MNFFIWALIQKCPFVLIWHKLDGVKVFFTQRMGSGGIPFPRLQVRHEAKKQTKETNKPLTLSSAEAAGLHGAGAVL